MILFVNKLLSNFYLYVDEYGFHFIDGDETITLSTDMNEALRFLKIKQTFSNLLDKKYKDLFQIFENSKYYNGALFLNSTFNKNKIFAMYSRRVKNSFKYKKMYYNYVIDFESTYRWVKEPTLYKLIVKRKYKGRNSSAHLRDNLVKHIKNKINSKVLSDKTNKSLQECNIKLKAFKKQFPIGKYITFEQYVINNTVENIIKTIMK